LGRDSAALRKGDRGDAAFEKERAACRVPGDRQTHIRLVGRETSAVTEEVHCCREFLNFEGKERRGKGLPSFLRKNLGAKESRWKKKKRSGDLAKGPGHRQP